MYTFKKAERLVRRKLIDKLFRNGRSFFIYPVKVNFLKEDHQGKYPCRVLIGVINRSQKKAVERNLLKRRMREAYRHNKHILYDYLSQVHSKYIISLIYTGKVILPYHSLEKIIILILHRLIQEDEKNTG